MRIALCQLAGRTLDEAPAALAAARGLVADAAARGADLVVVPEGAYPGYVLGSADDARRVLAAGPDPVAAFAELAARHRVTLVAGLVLDRPAGLTDSAVTFGPDGRVLSTTDKQLLWHADHRWFAAGADACPVVDTPAGRVGALVCADARVPEVTQTLAAAGAAVIADPTAWVTSGRTPADHANVHPDFLLRARALETGAVLAAASKVGVEGPSVQYTGRSMVVGPDGDVLVEASATREEVVDVDVDVDGLPRPPVGARADRYPGLGQAAAAVQAAPTAGTAHVAVLTPDPSRPWRALLDHAVAAAADLVVIPDVAAGGGNPTEPELESAAAGHGVWLAAVTGAGRDRAGVCVGPGGVAGRFPLVHGGDGAPAEPVTTGAGRVVVVVGPDGWVPEPSRWAVLAGAELVAWPCGADDGPVGDHRRLAVLGRARACENAVFVAQAAALPADGWSASQVVAPGGAVVAAGPVGRPAISGADCRLALAGDKRLAPATDALAGRRPAAYAPYRRAR